MIRTWARFLLLLLVVGAGVPITQGAPVATTAAQVTTVYTKSNGTIQIKLNQPAPGTTLHYPMITEMSINGLVVLSHDNAGADLQMSTRSWLGNTYNPTLGGNCLGTPSVMTDVLSLWSGIPGVSTANGILMAVHPQNYAAPGGGFVCDPGSASLLPYKFHFGVTLGDAVPQPGSPPRDLPKEAMVLDLGVQRQPTTPPKPIAQEVVKAGSEMPIGFFKTSILHYAYYSTDGVTFQPLNKNNTNDTQQWPINTNITTEGQVIYLSTAPNAHINQTTGFGVAFYSHTPTGLTVSHRIGATGDLTLISTVGATHNSLDFIPTSDYEWHVLRRLVIVGHVAGIRTVIIKANNRITNWGNW